MDLRGRRPNFLVMLTDQQRWDGVACNWPTWRKERTTLATPRLDRLAAEGVRFERQYINHPICQPSRATMLTGLTPRGHGLRTNGINLDPRWPTLGATLAAAGYRTHCVGKVHANAWQLPWGPDPETLDPAAYPECQWMWDRGKVTALARPYYGFERVEAVMGHGPWMWGEYSNWLKATHPDVAARFTLEAAERPVPELKSCQRLAMPAELHYNAWIADRTIAYLEGAAQRDEPFMVWASFPDPHGPFAAPEPWYSMFDRAAVPRPVVRAGEEADMAPHVRDDRGKKPMPEAHLREITAVTYGMIAFLDEQCGRILDAVDRLNLRENTVVLFLSDHGEMLGDHGMIAKGPWPYDGINRVPSIWRFQGRFPEGKVSQALASYLDFTPTLLDLAGVPVPSVLTIPGTAKSGSKLAPLAGRSLAPVLRGEWEAVHEEVVIEYEVDHLGLRMRTVVTPTHQLTIYVSDRGEEPYGDLFDLAEDPGQTVNRWGDPACAKLILDLKARLLRELVRTDSRYPLQHTGF